MSQFEKYWKELQRRHVVKAGIAYLVVTWLIVQVITVLLPMFGISDSISRTVVVILAMGFPIWLILAWVYDFSWGSIQKTEDVPFDAEVSRKKNVGLNRVIIGGLAIAVILLLVNTFRLSSKVDEIEDQFLAMEFTNSLAILPFEDLSPKQDQRYFSDGLARSIYDRLARYKDLKLISPTSSFQYRDKDVSIEVIAEELGVRYILEGSVQLFENTYRASINLVDTQDGSTIWSKPFEDNLENVLGTYDEVSENVGSYLNVTLISEDVRQRKVDPEAYLLYLKANDTMEQEAHSLRSIVVADSMIHRSIQIDPLFARSQITLAQTTFHKTIYQRLIEQSEGLARAKEAAFKAIAIDPEDPLGYMWVSNLSWHQRDMEAYEEYLNKMIEKNQNISDIISFQGFHFDRTNQVAKAYPYYKESAILDPKYNEYNYNMAQHELYRANYKEAIKWLNKINSDWIEWKNMYLTYALLESGEDEKAAALIETLPAYLRDRGRIQLLVKRGKIDKARTKLQQFINFNREDPSFDEYAFNDYNHHWHVAILHTILGDHENAFVYLDKAYPEIASVTEELFLDFYLIPLHEDPRWEALLDRLGRDFNYDFKQGA